MKSYASSITIDLAGMLGGDELQQVFVLLSQCPDFVGVVAGFYAEVWGLQYRATNHLFGQTEDSLEAGLW